MFVVPSANKLKKVEFLYLCCTPYFCSNFYFYFLQVLEFGALFFTSKSDLGLGSPSSEFEEQSRNLKNFLNSISNRNLSVSFLLQDLYDHFEVKLKDLEVSSLFLFLFIFYFFNISKMLSKLYIYFQSDYLT